MTEIIIPPVELIETGLLRVDGQNPNYMNPKQLDALEKSIKRYGFLFPIITNQDYLIADGEQKLTVARERLKLPKVPVIRLPIADVDRRILRQVLNKLKGRHRRELDAAEYQLIMEQGRIDELTALTALNQEHINNVLNTPDPGKETFFQEKYELIVECNSEDHQRKLYEKLTAEGYKCRVLTL